MSELTDAIRAGNVEAVAALVDADPALLSSRENRVSPLLLALYHGKGDIAQLVVDRGAPVSFGEACALGDLSRVTSMLESDSALLEERSDDGFPPLGLAIFFRHPDVARLLIERGANVSAPAENAMRVAPAHAAAAACDRDTMRLLLERGADANARQQMEYTPLHTAAARGDKEMTLLLLSHGADRTLRGSDGLSAADAARSHGHPEFAEWLESL
jgi:ankyrin repeat protein